MPGATGSSAPTFDGFGPGVHEFFAHLADNNDRAWFTAHKAEYEREVKAPLELLFAALEPEFGVSKLFRINRDVRFSKDKSPYKTQTAGMITRPSGSTLYLHVDAAGVMVGVGGPHFDRDQLERYREAVAGPAGEELATTIGALRRKKFVVGALGANGIDPAGDLKRVPAGFPPDHPRGDLLRYKSLIVASEAARPAWLLSGKAVGEVARRWRAMMPLADWLDAHVGAASPRDRGPRGR